MAKQQFFKWQKGQRDTGYYILTLIRTLIFDCYIIKYPQGSYIPPHTDLVKGKRHYRINLVLTHPPGGEFICADSIYKSKWLNFFRPDKNVHSVTKVEKGTRYVFSIGWATKR